MTGVNQALQILTRSSSPLFTLKLHLLCTFFLLWAQERTYTFLAVYRHLYLLPALSFSSIQHVCSQLKVYITLPHGARIKIWGHFYEIFIKIWIWILLLQFSFDLCISNISISWRPGNKTVLYDLQLMLHLHLNKIHTRILKKKKNHILEELTTEDHFHNMKNIHQHFVFFVH